VTLYANTTVIATQTVTLASGDSATIIFTWDTFGLAPGIYTISAFVILSPGETNNWAGSFTYGTIDVALHFGGGGGTGDPLDLGAP